MRVATALFAVVLVAGCGTTSVSSSSPSSAIASATIATLPAGYTLHSGDGFSIGLPAGWVVATELSEGVVLNATNTSADHDWQLLLGRTVDAKPAGQSFEEYVAEQRSICSGASPDTIQVPAGSAYICRVDEPTLELQLLDYRLPAGGDVWSLALAFHDGKYSGIGQTEAETILRTLVLTP